jgi:hypothetical protein
MGHCISKALGNSIPTVLHGSSCDGGAAMAVDTTAVDDDDDDDKTGSRRHHDNRQQQLRLPNLPPDRRVLFVTNKTCAVYPLSGKRLVCKVCLRK